jgi:S1-C subfamily serine protease
LDPESPRLASEDRAKASPTESAKSTLSASRGRKMEIPTKGVAASLLPLGFVCVSLYAQTRSVPTRQILNLNGPSVLKIEAHDKQDALTAQGSGVVIAPSGIVATNAHVVSGACNLYIRQPSGSLVAVKGIVQIDPDKDIAILRFDSRDLRVATLGDSRALRVGDRVVAIGSPLGLEQTVSEGIVSGLRTIENQRSVIQTTAPISPGSSGGGLFNGKGELIGLTTFTLQDSQNLNFAAPLVDVLDLLKRGSETPWSGMSCSETASSLDAMVINQRLLGREISDPQVAEAIKMLNGGTAPTPFQEMVGGGLEMRSYNFPGVQMKVWFQNGRCDSVLYFSGFAGILPLGLSWDKSQSEVRQILGVPSGTWSPSGTDINTDEYDFGENNYIVWYAKDGKLKEISVFLESH